VKSKYNNVANWEYHSQTALSQDVSVLTWVEKPEIVFCSMYINLGQSAYCRIENEETIPLAIPLHVFGELIYNPDTLLIENPAYLEPYLPKEYFL